MLAELEHLPAHLREQSNLFSMDDLQKVKKGQLVPQAKAVLQSAITHVENCEVSHSEPDASLMLFIS